jgi:DNA invertase Pin-like site-specific DNA recombinase
MSKKVTILYARLSHGDELMGESNSISNQRCLLEEFAERNNLTPYECLVDDDYSGTNFSRPGWQELIRRVDNDEVSCLCLKDSSRMARNYLQAGLYREMFREKGVRLICVNDGTDTINGEDDFTPFREIINEYYARDCSRKIKSAYAAKGKSGKHLTNKVIYGYRKDPADKNIWLVDPEAAVTVKRVFDLTLRGFGPFQIARMLYEEKVEIPAYYLAKNGIVANKKVLANSNPYLWSYSSISSMLAREEYAGHTVNFRTTRISYKSKKFKQLPKEGWLIFPHTHEAIVSQETFDLVQKLRETVRRTDTTGESNPLTGLIYCADCGSRMYNHRGKAKIDQYQCSDYSRASNRFQKEHCSPHYVTTVALREILLDVIRKTSGYVREHEADFVEKVRETAAFQHGETVKTHKRQITKNEKRIVDLEKMFKTLYEDRVSGALSIERFTQLSGEYENEQIDLREKNKMLQADIDEFNADSKRGDQFITLVQKFTRFDELTTPMVNEFIERIEVHEGVWSEGKRYGSRSQQVDVYLKYIGKFDVPDLRTPEEIEIEQLAEEKRERRRTANRESTRRYWERKKAEKAAAELTATQTKTP